MSGYFSPVEATIPANCCPDFALLVSHWGAGIERAGTEFTSNATLGWHQDHGVDWDYIAPGKLTQNRLVETFIGRLRDECRNEHVFTNPRSGLGVSKAYC